MYHFYKNLAFDVFASCVMLAMAFPAWAQEKEAEKDAPEKPAVQSIMQTVRGR